MKFKDLFNFSNKENVQKKSKKMSYKGYNFGQYNSNRADWKNGLATSENYDLKANHDMMIRNSRLLLKNSPIAKKYLNMCVSNIIGDKGFMLQSDCFDLSFKNGQSQKIIDKIASDTIEEHYQKFGQKGNCDVTEQYNLNELLETMLKSYCTDGEILYLNVVDPNFQYGYKVQILDAQRIDSLYNDSLQNGNTVNSGIELDKFGKVIAYYIKEYDAKSIDYNTQQYTRKRYLKGQAELVFKKMFPEQIRGVPPLHAVGEYIKNLEDYNDATMQAAKIGTSMSIYLTKEDNTNNSNFADGQDDDGEYFYEMDNTKIMSVPSGFKVNGFQGSFPAETYKIYTKRMLQLIATGLNVSHVFLGNDAEDLNYSTSRTTSLEERENWKKEQQFFINNIVSPIFLNFLKYGLLNKKINLANGSTLPFEKFEKFSNHRFYGRTWDLIDKTAEVDANIVLLQNGLLTKTQLLAQQGIDFEDILIIKQKEEELLKKYNINSINNIDANNTNNYNTNQNINN